MVTSLVTPTSEPVVVSTRSQRVPAAVSPAPSVAPNASDWRQASPVLEGENLTLRALEPSDAESLLTLLTTDEVARFLSPPPTSIEGFQRFINWANQKREDGSYVCFGVVPRGMNTAVGLFQLRALNASFTTAEWGFALGRPFWGTGLFVEGATHTLDFAFGTVGVQRLEARSAVGNGRGNAALRKIGAVHEAVLRRSFQKNGQVHDQVLWSILDIDWFTTRTQAHHIWTGFTQRWH